MCKQTIKHLKNNHKHTTLKHIKMNSLKSSTLETQQEPEFNLPHKGEWISTLMTNFYSREMCDVRQVYKMGVNEHKQNKKKGTAATSNLLQTKRLRCKEQTKPNHDQTCRNHNN